jgi:hypothetical protein
VALSGMDIAESTVILHFKEPGYRGTFFDASVADPD